MKTTLVSYSNKNYEVSVQKEHNSYVVIKTKRANLEKVEEIKTPSLEIAMELFYDIQGEIQFQQEKEEFDNDDNFIMFGDT